MKRLRWIAGHFEEILMMFFLVLITAIMFFQVVMRYVFKSSLSWSDELCRYTFVWLIFIGISYSVRNNLHLRVDILEQFFPVLRRPLEILGDLVFVVFSLFMIRPGLASIQMVALSKQTSVALDIPMWLIYLSLFLDLFLILIRLIEKYAKKLIKYRADVDCVSESKGGNI